MGPGIIHARSFSPSVATTTVNARQCYDLAWFKYLQLYQATLPKCPFPLVVPHNFNNVKLHSLDERHSLLRVFCQAMQRYFPSLCVFKTQIEFVAQSGDATVCPNFFMFHIIRFYTVWKLFQDFDSGLRKLLIRVFVETIGLSYQKEAWEHLQNSLYGCNIWKRHCKFKFCEYRIPHYNLRWNSPVIRPVDRAYTPYQVFRLPLDEEDDPEP